VSTLVVMAAGLGSRYGSPKQIDRVGPSHETLVEYAVFDARRAGFTRVVFVIRPDLSDAFKDLAARLPADIAVDCAIQDLSALPPGVAGRPRTRPWGTVHAVLAARSLVSSPFAVLNADDFYGSAAYRIAREACDEAARHASATVVGFPLAATLSPHGPVVRAVCVAENGWLTAIDEVYGLEPAANGIRGWTASGAPRLMQGTEIASMNLWVFPPAIFALLAVGFERFVRGRGRDGDAELPLPEAVGELISQGAVRVRVREAPGPWFGLTHRQDREALVAELRALVASGTYPHALWR
jgi:hypothetical protein